jgi:hypothetical protein
VRRFLSNDCEISIVGEVNEFNEIPINTNESAVTSIWFQVEDINYYVPESVEYLLRSAAQYTFSFEFLMRILRYR